MPQKTWFFEGKTIVSPEFKQSGKPFQINREIKKLYVANLPKPKTLSEKLSAFIYRVFPSQPKQQLKRMRIQNDDPSVYSDDPRDTQEDDMESDLGLLNEEDDLW